MRTLFVLLLLLFLGLRAFAEPTAAELNNLGGTAFKAGHYSEAIPLFQKAVALDPGDRFYVANLAASLRKTSRFEDAQAVLTTAMAAFSSPEDKKALRIEIADTQFFWGDSLLTAGENVQAVPHFQAALAIDRAIRPGDAAFDLDKLAFAVNSEGKAAFDAGKYADAVPLFQQAAAFAPGTLAYATNLAAALRSSGRLEEAQVVLAAAQPKFLKPDDHNSLLIALADVYFDRAQEFVKQDKLAEAVPLFQQAAEIDRTRRPKDAGYDLEGLGQALHVQGKDIPALAAYHESLKFRQALTGADKNADSEASSLKGVLTVSLALKRYADATRAYDALVRLKPQGEADPKAQAVLLNQGGLALYGGDRYPEADPRFREAIRLDPTEEAYVLNLARSLCYGEKFAEAQTLLETRLQDFPQPEDQKELRVERAEMHFSWGDFLLKTHGAESALPHFQAALAIDREIRPEETVFDLDRIAIAYTEMSRFETAIEYNELTLTELRKVADRRGEARTLNGEGLANYHLSRYPEASKLYESARQISRELGDLSSEATALSNLGTVCGDTGRYPEAIGYYKSALAIQQKLKDRGAQAKTLNNVALIYYHLGQAREAVVLYTQALHLWREVKDRLGEGTALGNLGAAYNLLSLYPRAIEFYAQALPIQREFKDNIGEARTLSNMASTWMNLQHYDQTIELDLQALQIEREIGARSLEATTLNNLGSATNELGQCERAIEYFLQALAICQAVSDRAGEAADDNNIAESYTRLSKYEQAVPFYRKSLAISQKIEDKIGEATTLSNLGDMLQQAEQYERALTFLNQALLLRRETGDRDGEGIALNNLGGCYENMHRPDQAQDFYRQALVIEREVKDRAGEAVTLNNLMYFWKDQHKPAFAIFYGKMAVNDYQSVRGDVRSLSKETQKAYIASLAGTYRTLAEILIQAGRFEEAQKVLGMLKEEEFFDFVGRDPSTAKALTAAARLTPSEAGWAASYRKATDGPAMTAFFQRMTTAAAVTNQAKVARKTAVGTASVYTIVEPDKLQLILTTPIGQVAREYPIAAPDLYRKVLALRNALQYPTRDPRPLAQELYKIVVGPIEADLKTAHATTLLWSLDDALRYLPVAALYDGNHYLVERYDNALLTLAAPTRTASATDVPWTGLGLGVSLQHPGFDALPGVRAELSGIFGPVVPGTALLDTQFTQRSFLAGLKHRNHPLVHIASHFSLSGRDTDSFLLLGDGGHLSLADLKADPNVFQGVDLLTLSACNTAMEVRSASGKEVEGFGALAQRLGARSVLASLWPVADASTPTLMREFYRLRHANPKLGKAAGLRQAQLELLRGRVTASSAPSKANRAQRAKVAGAANTDLPLFVADPKAPYAHPFYWAPFVLIGSPE